MKLENKIVNKIFYIFDNFKFKFFLLNIIFLISSVFELLGISVIIPFLIFIFDADVAINNQLLNYLNSFIQDKQSLFYSIFCIFIIKYLIFLYANYVIPKIFI